MVQSGIVRENATGDNVFVVLFSVYVCSTVSVKKLVFEYHGTTMFIFI